jgi:drug/metabolite transporter (DMT)-like permease
MNAPIRLSMPRALAELVCAALLFGVTSYVAKQATRTADSSQVVFIRFAIGSLFVLGQAALWRKGLFPVKWVPWLLRGFFGGLAVSFYFLSLKHLPVGTATLLNCSSPIFASLFAWLFLREQLTKARIGALAIAVAGVILVFLGQGKTLAGSIGWQVIALLSGVCAGAAIVTIRLARRTDGSWVIFSALCLVGMLSSAPWALVHWNPLSTMTWFLLVLVALFSLTGQILMTHALGTIPTSLSVTISQLTVLSAIFLGFFFDHDPLTWTMLAGAVLILVGIVTASRIQTREALHDTSETQGTTMTSHHDAVLVPVHNEQNTVQSMLDDIRYHFSGTILVIDDGSTDETNYILRKRTDILLTTFPSNVGYGYSLRFGFQWARRLGMERLVTLDADGQHLAHHIPNFLEALDQGWDVVSGSRYLPQSRVIGETPTTRKEINHSLTNIINHHTSWKLTDAFCGYKSYRVSRVTSLCLHENGYAFPMQFWAQAWKNSLRIREYAVERIYLDATRQFGGHLDIPEQRMAHYLHIWSHAITCSQAAHD